MENELEIKRVPFMGAELMAARDTDGQIWAGVSYICNGIGLNKNEKDRQVKNVQTDRVLKKGCVKFDAGVFDPNNQTVAIKLDFVPPLAGEDLHHPDYGGWDSIFGREAGSVSAPGEGHPGGRFPPRKLCPCSGHVVP